MKSIIVDGVEYVAKTGPTKRAVLVIDRGWIFAGDVSEDGQGTVTLSNAVHVFRWESIGFDGMIKEPKSSKVTLKKMNENVCVPESSIIFFVPVGESWGL